MKIRTLLMAIAGSAAMLASAELPKPDAIVPEELLPISSVKRQNKIFEAATTPLDKGGDYYSFQNVYALTKYAKYAPLMLGQAVLANGGEKEDADAAVDICRLLVEVINPSVLKAVASSSAELEAGLYRSKSYSYLGKRGMSQPSLFDLTGKVNHKLNWQDLPADTRLALDTDFHPGILYRRAISALQKASSPDLKNIPAQLEALKKQGIDIETPLNSIDHLSLIVIGSNAQTLGVLITISDNSGKIAEQLKVNFPPEEGSNVAVIPLPVPMCVPAICYGEKKITLTTNKELLTRKFPAKVGDISKFRKFAAVLPSEGTGYFYVNMDDASVNELKAALVQTEKGALAAKLLAPFAILGISNAAEEGYLTTVASDFSFNEAAMKLSVIMPAYTMVSAFTDARKAAKKAACAAHFKQAGVALLDYAGNHKNILPKTLQDLQAEMDGECPVCAQGKVLYLAAEMDLSKLENPAIIPLLLEAPPAHKDGACVLFADGHVAFVPVARYKDPAQLIVELNKAYSYTPEQLDAMLKAVSAK